MRIDIEHLSDRIKLEVTKADLEAFAHTLLAQHKSKVPPPSVSAKKIMTVDELANYLNIARQTIYGWIHQRKIPYHKHPTGRKVYFLQTEIDEWLTANRRDSSSEIEAQAIRHIEEQKKKRRTR